MDYETARTIALLGIGMLVGMAVAIPCTAKWMWWRIKSIERRYLLHEKTCGQLTRGGG